MTPQQTVRAVIDATQPLPFPRGERLPVRAWGLQGWIPEDDAQALDLLRQLDARGLAVNAVWRTGDQQAQSLRDSLRLGRLQKQLGLGIGVNANACMYSFFNGDENTFHVAEDGTRFHDDTFSAQRKMGCPFSVKPRYQDIKAQFEPFLKAYADAGLDIEFIFADWEIDGPIEWNGAWERSKRCVQCRRNIPDLDDFRAFQRALRTIRCEMQRGVYAETVKAYFPNALIGNYGVYPHDGYRYWYDYYEEFVEGAPFRPDQRAKYREWFHEFPLTGYTFAMPVVYTWRPLWDWYDYELGDYRWFYNMLLVATNACQHTPSDVPVISWVHWHTTDADPDAPVPQFSAAKYQELLWHMLLRGCDAFINWCPADESADEVRLVQEVYAASLEYGAFLDGGTPLLFDVPRRPGPVVSALRFGDRALVRRTDFDDNPEPVRCRIGDWTMNIPRRDGRCQVIGVRDD